MKCTIDEIERMLEGITPGEWVVDDVNPELVAAVSGDGYYEYVADGDSEAFVTVSPEEILANMKFIASAPQIIRDLLSERDKLRGALSSIFIHINLPCEKRDDGVIQQTAEDALCFKVGE